MNESRSLLNDGIWVAITQVIAALGTLAGVRILTEFMSPAVFGEMNLWLGIVALFTATLANPTMQALLRFYPEYAGHGQGRIARKIARHQVEKLLAWALPLMLILALVALWNGWVGGLHLMLFGMVLGIDIVRMQNMAVLSASSRQKTYGAWLAVEAWLRPAFAVLVMQVNGVNLASIFGGYFLASLLIWLVLRARVPDSNFATEDADEHLLKERFWRYTLPLLPLGLVGWLSGMGDRYIIGGVLSVSDVGMYAAAYGLASRPVLMLGAVVETALRPGYQRAVISGDSDGEHGYLRKWSGILLVCSIIGLVLAFLLHEWLARVFLGPSFRSGSYLIPWLVLAHIFLVFAQRNGRILYAHSKTYYLAKVEAIPAIFSLLASWYLTLNYGLEGAVSAVAFGFLIQLCMSHFLTKKLSPNK